MKCAFATPMGSGVSPARSDWWHAKSRHALLGASCEWGYGGVARRWRESAVCGVGDGVGDGWRVADALLLYRRGTKKAATSES